MKNKKEISRVEKYIQEKAPQYLFLLKHCPEKIKELEKRFSYKKTRKEVKNL